MKFSIFIQSLVNSVGLLILYSFLGVRFMVVMLVEVVNEFVAVDAIYFQRFFLLDLFICFLSGSVMLTECISWIACSFVMPSNILRYNQVYSLFIQSSCQTPEFS